MPGKSRPEIVLEAFRILIWPVLAVMAVFWFGDDVKEILRNRTWKIGVVEVGDRISNLESTLQDELIIQKDYLNKILATPSDSSKIVEYANQAMESIENAQKGVKKAVKNIQEAIPAGLTADLEDKAPASGQVKENRIKVNSAKDWETLGFKHLIEKDIRSAIEAFTNAEKLWPDYHNVAEIRKLLVQNQEALEKPESPEWKDVYETITNQLSWGMTQEVRAQMRKNIGS